MVQLVAFSQGQQLPRSAWSFSCVMLHVLSLLLACVSSEECIHPGTNTTGVYHGNHEYHSICCKPTDCAAGTEPVLCEEHSKNPTATCQFCANGTYQSGDHSSDRMEKCKPWRKCDVDGVGYVMEKLGTRKEDTTCGCNHSMGYLKDCHKGEDNCQCTRRWCNKGKQLSQSTGMCARCPDGHWKDSNGHHLCQPASKCQPNQSVVNESTSASDTVCEDRLITPSSVAVLVTTTEISAKPVHHLLGTTTIVLVVVCSLLGLGMLLLTAVIIIRCHVYDCGQHQLCKQVASWLHRRPLHDSEEGSDESLVAVANRHRKQNLTNSYREHCEATVDIHVDKAKVKQNGHVIQHQVSAVSEDSGCVEGLGNGDLLKGGREVLGRTSSVDQEDRAAVLEEIAVDQFEVEEEGNPSTSIYEVEEEPSARDSGTDSVGPQAVQANKDGSMPPNVVIEHLVMHGGNVTIGNNALTHIIGGQKVNKTYEVEEEEDCIASPFDPAQVHGMSGTHV